MHEIIKLSVVTHFHMYIITCFFLTLLIMILYFSLSYTSKHFIVMRRKTGEPLQKEESKYIFKA